jgi:hypothetical protein
MKYEEMTKAQCFYTFYTTKICEGMTGQMDIVTRVVNTRNFIKRGIWARKGEM